MVDSIGDTARKASAGTWRKPRVRIYDYNNVSQIVICLGVKLLKVVLFRIWAAITINQ